MMERFEDGAYGRSFEENSEEKPEVLEEIEIEDLTVDGICGVY